MLSREWRKNCMATSRPEWCQRLVYVRRICVSDLAVAIRHYEAYIGKHLKNLREKQIDLALVTDGLNRKEDSLSSSERVRRSKVTGAILEELAGLCGEWQFSVEREGYLMDEKSEKALSFVEQLIEKTKQDKLLWSRGFEDGQYKTLLPGGKLAFVIQVKGVSYASSKC